MPSDLLKAACLTMLLGTALLQSGHLIPQNSWELPIVLAGLSVSILAGVALLARRHRAHIVPIASVYIVVMLGLLILTNFVIGWFRGEVEM